MFAQGLISIKNFKIIVYKMKVFISVVHDMTLFIRATEFNPTNPSKKLRLEVPGFGDASPYMKAAKLEMERASREVMSLNLLH